jgi:adenine/guanine/hypoxanthine permease
LTVIVTALCFILALFLAPLILIIPAVATAPALVIVGAFMMQGLAELDLKDFEKAVPAFITILVMPLAFSITEGIAFGLLAYVGLKVGSGKSKEVGPVTYVLAVLFILHFLFGREGETGSACRLVGRMWLPSAFKLKQDRTVHVFVVKISSR